MSRDHAIALQPSNRVRLHLKKTKPRTMAETLLQFEGIASEKSEERKKDSIFWKLKYFHKTHLRVYKREVQDVTRAQN